MEPRSPLDAVHREFLRKYTAVQQSIFAYIRSAGIRLEDAEDLLQEAAVALWESYESYDPRRPFIGWALGVTRNLIYRQYRYDRIRQKVVVDSELCARISDHVSAALDAHEDALAEEKKQMEGCIKALPERSRALIRMRYHDRLDLKSIGTQIGQSYAGTHMLLSRIRARLLDCVSGGLRGARA